MPPPPHPPIIDSHIHLYPSSALDTLAWCPPSHPLHAQHSIDQYLASTSSSSPSTSTSTTSPSTSPSTPEPEPDPDLRGFIFIEADRKSSLHPNSPSPSTTPTEDKSHGWTHALSELSFAARISHGAPLPNEGRSPTHAPLLLGIIPWAPVPLGADGMKAYVSRARQMVGKAAWERVKGFRYLVQDKPPGTMGETGFVEGVRWCGREGFVFELGVDGTGTRREGKCGRGGMWQLDEGVGLLRRVYAGLEGRGKGEGAVVVIDHMCKPDMRSDDADPEERNAIFAEWEERIKQFARFPQTYMKLSGAFSEIPPLPLHDDARPWSVTPELHAAKSRIAPWVATVFRAFGPERIMFGSDWLVCNLRGGGGKVAWRSWRWVVGEILRDLGLSEDEKRAVLGGTAARAYKIS